MQADLYKEEKNKPIFRSIQPNTSIINLLNFIEIHAELFSKLYSDSSFNEKQLNQELEIILNNTSSHLGLPYTFKGNYIDIYTQMSDKKREVDLAVIFNENKQNTKAFFVFEMKRLPAPPPSNREQEYLIGDLGGIERFKKELHGRSLKFVGMIGYIQNHNFQYWFNQINKWILGLSKIKNVNDVYWDKSEILCKIQVSSKTARYISFNLGKSKYFKIFHIWLKI